MSNRCPSAPLYVYRKVDEHPLRDTPPTTIRIAVDHTKASLLGRRYTMPRLAAARSRS